MHIRIDKNEAIEVSKITIEMPSGEEIRITMDALQDLVINSTNENAKMVVMPDASNQFSISYKGGE